MTVQYEGNDIYKISIGQKELLLSQDEINEIQDWNFPNESSIGDGIEELEEIVEDKSSAIYETYDRLAKVITNIDELLEDDEIDYSGLLLQREKISEINQKLGEK